MKTKFGSAILCNSTTKGEDGKISCTDVFTSFLAWGFPSSARTWSIVFTLYNLPQGKTSVVASIAKGVSGRGEKTTLAAADVNHKGQNLGSIFSIPLTYQFESQGDYTILLQTPASDAKLIVPVRVIQIDWPEFSKKDIQIIRSNANIPRSIRSVINCNGCSNPYIFEEVFIPEQPVSAGTHSFPGNGIFECESCGRLLHLRDIQGQVRNSVRRAIDSAKMGGS